jgi:hypothetical protein
VVLQASLLRCLHDGLFQSWHQIKVRKVFFLIRVRSGDSWNHNTPLAPNLQHIFYSNEPFSFPYLFLFSFPSLSLFFHNLVPVLPAIFILSFPQPFPPLMVRSIPVSPKKPQHPLW